MARCSGVKPPCFFSPIVWGLGFLFIAWGGGSAPAGESFVDRDEALHALVSDAFELGPEIRTSTAQSVCEMPDWLYRVLRRGSPTSPLARGARRTMAAIYQSCSVLGLPPYDPVLFPLEGLRLQAGTSVREITDRDSLVSSHYYLQSLPEPIPSGCRDPRSPVPIYAFGAKPAEWKVYSQHTIETFTDLSGSPRCGVPSGYACGAPAARGIDCSGFVGASLASAGLRLRTDRPYGFPGTSTFLADVDPGVQPQSCFRNVSPADHGGLESGDIFVVGGNHVLIIDSAGTDPFGLSRVSSCDEISPEFFDFRVIQSSGAGNGIGVNRMEASTYFGDQVRRATEAAPGSISAAAASAAAASTPSLPGTTLLSALSSVLPPGRSMETAGFFGPLMAHARKACRIARGLDRPTSVRFSSASRILRHRGTPNCKTTPADPEAGSCTDSCELDSAGPRGRRRAAREGS